MGKELNILSRAGRDAVPPDDLQDHIQKGIEFHQAGRLRDAEAIYRQVLEIEPNHADAIHLLGVISHQAGRYEFAARLISEAILVNPGVANYHNNLGNVLEKLERLEDALSCYQKALTLEPDFAAAHGNLGNALQKLGRAEDAVASYRTALALKPDYARAHNNLGNVLEKLGQAEDAIAHCRSAIALDPQNDVFWDNLAKCLKTYAFASVNDDLLQVLSRLLQRPNVRPHSIVGAVISALRHHPEISRLLNLARSGNPQAEIGFADAAERLSAIPLLLQIMGLSVITDPEVENMLATLRRTMILGGTSGETETRGHPFLAALALHCFTNEYVFPETAEEKVAVERLERQIATLLENRQDVPPTLVATLGAYRPLYLFPWADKLREGEWTGGIKEMIARQIVEPMAERSLRAQIPRLTTMQDAVSQAVREQYEENPYPRWIKTSVSRKAKTIGDVLRDTLPDLDLDDYESPESPEILVAGCGTGQHALATAAMYLGSRVLAVDLSLNSLAYAERKTIELGVTNIAYAHGDILELGRLGRRFDLIECAGVLHHLGDPMAGWRVLVDLLRPGGLMKIALYSETARSDIVKARALIADKGYTTSANDIRRWRTDITALIRDGNPGMPKSVCCLDFFSLGGCRDMLFHVREHRFTLPQIEADLKDLKLKFLGFDMKQRGAMGEFRKSHPDHRAPTSLSLWHRFELRNSDTFSAMYRFWCRKM